MVTKRICRRCRGSGREPLPPPYVEVVRLLRERPRTLGEVTSRLGIARQAAQNRLARLLNWRVVSRRRKGGQYVYEERRGS